MDGCVHSATSPPKPTDLYIEVCRSIVSVLDPTAAPVRKEVVWSFGRRVHLERSLIDGELWLTVHGQPAGLPIEGQANRINDPRCWRTLWENDYIRLHHFVDDRWQEVEDIGRV